MRSVWSVLLGLLLAHLTVLGQQQDVRLSPEPVSYLLPTDLRIQSAASIGSTALVAWGTVVAEGQSGGVKNALRFQLLRDTTPVGLQRTLHGDEAIPHSVVRVLEVMDRYLVLWNDRRAGAEGIYAQIVDTAGNFVGDEKQISNGILQADSLVWRVRSSTGWFVVWQDTLAGGRLRGIKLDDRGNPTDTPATIAMGAYRWGQQFSAIPGLLLLKDQSGNAFAFWGDSGTAPMPLPSDHFKGSYFLDADRSLLVLKDTTLFFYNSFVDTIPAKTLQLSFGFNIPYGSNLLRGTPIVIKDDSGGISVIYMRERIALENVSYISHLYRQRVQGDTLGRKDTLAVLKYLDYTHGGFAGYRTKFDAAIISQGFDNTTLVTVRFIEEEIQNYMIYRRVPKSLTFAHSTKALIGPFQDSALPRPLRRLGIGGLPIERRLFDTISSVSVAVASGAEQLLTTKIAGETINTPQLRPNVIEREGTLLVTYNQPEDKAKYLLGVWDAGVNSTVRMLRPLSIPTYYTVDVDKTYQSTTEQLYGMNYAVIQHGFFTSKYTQRRGETPTTTYTEESNFYIATDTGWCKAIKFNGAAVVWHGIHSAVLVMRPLEFQYNPEQKMLYGGELIQEDPLATIPKHQRRYIYALTPYGKVQWQIDNVPVVVPEYRDSVKAIIPIADKEFLAIYPASQQHLKDTVVMEQSFLPQINGKIGYLRYMALRNQRYLRYYSMESAPNTLLLEIFSHSGTLLDSTSLQFNSLASRVAITQNPADRSIALLYGGAGGAKLTLLSERLRVQKDMDAGMIPMQDYPISATRDTVGLVAGIFRNDTLFAVWEDLRNGTPDIYSTAWKTPETMVAPILPPPSLAISTNQPISITAVAPIPCKDQLIVQHHLAEGGIVTFDILDDMGRSVKQITKKLPQGVSESHLVTDDLFPGGYAARMRSQHGEAIIRFLVVR